VLPSGEAERADRAIDDVILRSVERFARARERTLAALDRVSSAALGTGDLATFLPRLLNVILETTEAADSAYVLLREGDVLRVRAAEGVEAARSAGFAVHVGEGFAGTVAQRREPLLVRDAGSDPFVLNPAIRGQPVHAMYGVPLLHDDQVVGVAKMASRSAYDFSDDDKQLFRVMAQRATSLIVQAQLVQGRHRLMDALEHADAFLLLDRDFRILQVNHTQEVLSRTRREDTVGRVFWDVWPDTAGPDSPYWREYQRCMRERVPVEFEARYAPLDLWTSASAFPTPDGGIAVFLRDVSARKRAEVERDRTLALLRTSEARLRRIVESNIVGVIFWRLSGEIAYANDRFLEIIGRDHAALARGEIDWRRLTPPEWAQSDAAQVERLRREGAHPLYEKEYLHRDGRRVPVLVASAAFPDDPEHGVSFVLDITAEKRRSEFEQQLVGIVSHDLRSPLNAILLGASSLLMREELDARTVKAVNRIRSSAERATRMVQDLLDFTRARVGQGIPVTPGPMDLHVLARHVVDEVQVTYPDRTIELMRMGRADGEWDADRLAQAMTNLLVNALKYSPRESAVTVRTRDAGPEVAFEVHNEGEPIPPDARERLFEPYRRLDDGAGGGRESLGLGLYITREIVRAHGGTVEVDSAPERGTTFTVRLPRRERR
jgi:PAS domain S-box-containing protein